MAAELNNLQQVPVTITFKDNIDPNLGSPALVTNVTLVISDPTILSVSVPAGSDPSAPVSTLVATVATVGALGTATLTITGTNPDGSVVTNTQDFTVTAAAVNALSIQIAVGTPVNKA